MSALKLWHLNSGFTKTLVQVILASIYNGSTKTLVQVILASVSNGSMWFIKYQYLKR